MLEEQDEKVQVERKTKLKRGGVKGEKGSSVGKEMRKGRRKKENIETTDLAVIFAETSIKATLGHVWRGARPGNIIISCRNKLSGQTIAHLRCHKSVVHLLGQWTLPTVSKSLVGGSGLPPPPPQPTTHHQHTCWP